jgi:hypothetical protein
MLDLLRVELHREIPPLDFDRAMSGVMRLLDRAAVKPHAQRVGLYR